MCEDTREAQCNIPTFSLIKAWDRSDDTRWSNEIVVPQFVYTPTSMYRYPWAHKKLPGGAGLRRCWAALGLQPACRLAAGTGGCGRGGGGSSSRFALPRVAPTAGDAAMLRASQARARPRPCAAFFRGTGFCFGYHHGLSKCARTWLAYKTAHGNMSHLVDAGGCRQLVLAGLASQGSNATRPPAGP
jgi:hypothetical protein